MWNITKEFRFEAAHSLPHLPEGHQCKRHHGHSYLLRIHCQSDALDNHFVVDFAEISRHVKPLVEKMDHQDLNTLFNFPTTSENLSKHIFEVLKYKVLNIIQVDISETLGTCCSYRELIK